MEGATKNSNKQQAKQRTIQHPPDPSVTCFALEPRTGLIAVAVNDIVRIISVRYVSLVRSSPTAHCTPVSQALKRLCRQPLSPKPQTIPTTEAASIRAVAFDPTGKLFLSAGDDKLVKVWDTDSWHLIQTVWVTKDGQSCLLCPLAMSSHD